MIYRIIYAAAARADLRDIASYFRQVAGDVVAEAVINKLLEGIETLAIRPARHRLRNELSHGLRSLRIGNYTIFYRVEGSIVEIARVLHGSRSITAELFGSGARDKPIP